MAAPATKNMLRIPGTIVKDPTNLSAAYPYGGTILGLVHQIVFKPMAKSHAQTAEEWGEQVVEVFYGGTSVILAATLRGMDDDAYAAVWPDTETGSPSGEKKVTILTTAGRAGSKLSALSMKILFVPESAIRHRAVLIRDAIPIVAEDASLAFASSEEIALSVAFLARPDSSDRVAEIGYIKDMTL